MNKEQKAIIKASGVVLTEHLTLDLLEGDESVLNVFLESHAYQPYEYLEAKEIFNRIDEIAYLLLEGV